MNLIQGESHYHKNNSINALQADYKDNIYIPVLKYLVTCDLVLSPLGIGRHSIYLIHLNKTHIATHTFVLLNIEIVTVLI